MMSVKMAATAKRLRTPLTTADSELCMTWVSFLVARCRVDPWAGVVGEGTNKEGDPLLKHPGSLYPNGPMKNRTVEVIDTIQHGYAVVHAIDTGAVGGKAPAGIRNLHSRSQGEATPLPTQGGDRDRHFALSPIRT